MKTERQINLYYSSDSIQLVAIDYQIEGDSMSKTGETYLGNLNIGHHDDCHGNRIMDYTVTKDGETILWNNNSLGSILCLIEDRFKGEIRKVGTTGLSGVIQSLLIGESYH